MTEVDPKTIHPTVSMEINLKQLRFLIDGMHMMKHQMYLSGLAYTCLSSEFHKLYDQCEDLVLETRNKLIDLEQAEIRMDIKDAT